MENLNKPFDLFPNSYKDITPYDFLTMSKAERKNIKSVIIIPPQIGRNDFGKIRIEFNSPLYEMRQVRENC